MSQCYNGTIHEIGTLKVVKVGFHARMYELVS